MNERTHSWIAIRAIALLEENGSEKDLVALLKPHARKASVGAWIPDQVDAKRGGAGNSTDCHVLKMEPYEGTLKGRFVVKKDDLLEKIGTYRKTHGYLQKDPTLKNDWWAAAFRGDIPKAGQHLPNRIMALSTMLKDLLLMGDKRVDQLIPGDIRFAQYMAPELRTSAEAAAMYFFMLSHFVADVNMPCHCDGRKLSGYSEGLHMELEDYWSKKVGTGFDKKNLLKEDTDTELILETARGIDKNFGLSFDSGTIPDLHDKHDVWLETMYLCRASFAIASIIAPYKEYQYESDMRAPFETLFPGNNNQALTEVSSTILHDAVLNSAIIWKHIWNKVSVHG